MTSGGNVPEAARRRGYTMTTDEVAEYCAVIPNTVYIWVRTGRLHALKLARHLYFRPEDVDAVAVQK